MAVADTYEILEYPGAGTTDTFAITWAYNATSDVLVYLQDDSDDSLTLLTVTTDYTITAAGDSGTVTLVAGNLASGYTLFIKREEAPAQGTSWANSRSINVLNIEAADDKLTRLVQQHEETLERCFKVPINSDDDPGDMSSTDLETVAGITSEITTVAGIATNVTTVAGISADVTTIVGIAADVSAVAVIDSDVTAVAAIDSDVTTCAADIAAIVAAPTEAANAAQSAIDAADSAASISLPLPVASGGTASTTAADARTALGLAIGSNIQAYDADTLKSDVSRVRTKSHPGTKVALTDAATVTPDLTAGDSFTWILGTDRNLGDMTVPGVGCWPITVTGEHAVSVHANWKLDADGEAADPATATRVFFCYSLNGTSKRILIKAQEDA